MTVLETTVISEVMKPGSDAAVTQWLDRQRAGTLYLSATTLCELLAGIAILPAGRRRDGMREMLDRLIGSYFDQRVLPLDREGAEAYAELVQRARAMVIQSQLRMVRLRLSPRSRGLPWRRGTRLHSLSLG